MAYSISEDYKLEEITLARIAKAMGHPARIVILKYLSSLDTCYFGDIYKELPISKATVSQHLAELKDAGLIKGSLEPPRVNYCINKENYKIAENLFDSFFRIKKTKKLISCCK